LAFVPSLFVSHSSRDEAAVTRLRAWLDEREHVSLFLDTDVTRGIAGGARWEAELYSQLRRADAVLFVASKASVESRWCFAELAMARSLGKPIIPVSVDGEVSHPLLGDVQRIVLDDEVGPARLERALALAGLGAERSFGWDGRRSPFPGLSAFEERDAGVFFGRTHETEALLALLRSSRRRHTGRLLAVLGPSGSGKSSLVAAGVLPRLRRERREWSVLPVMRPGERPLRQLALSLAGGFRAADATRAVDDLERALEHEPEALTDLAEELALPGAEDRERSALLVVDQAEELVTLAARTDGERFLRLLHAATRGPGLLWVILTLRLEVVSALLQWDGGGFDDELLLGPLESGRLFEVIERPAARAGVDFEAGLVGRMVHDTGGGDALPLLAFTLSELYQGAQRRSRHAITEEDYDSGGGVVGALRARADTEHARLRDRGLGDLVLPTLIRLVTIGPDGEPARRRFARRLLDEREQLVVDAFVDARLLAAGVRDGEPVVEVAHEALLRQWPPLTEAIEHRRDELRMAAELERAAADWERNQQAEDYLLTGQRLTAAEGLRREAQPDAVQRLLAASTARARRERRERTRRTRLAFAALGAALVLVTGLALFALVQANRAVEQRDIARANQLASEALFRQSEDSGDALRLAHDAYSTHPTNLAEAALRFTASKAAPETIVRPGQGTVRGVAFSRDGRHLASAGDDGTVRVYDWRAPAAPPTILRTGDYSVHAVAFAPDGHHLASAGLDGTVHVYNWRAPATSPTILGTGKETVSDVAFTSDGRYLASAGTGSVRVFDWRSPAALPKILDTEQGSVQGVAFAGDGRYLASAGGDGTVKVYDWREPAAPPIILRTGQGSVNGVAFAGDGRHLASAGKDGTVRVIDWRDPGARPTVFETGQGSVNGVAFAGDGRHLASAGKDGTVRVVDWRAPAGSPPTILRTGQGGVNGVAFAGDGPHVAGAGDDGSVRIYDMRAGAAPPTILGPGQYVVSDVAFASDGRHLASGGADGTVSVYDWRAPTAPPRILRTGPGSAYGVAFAGDGGHVASVGKDGTVRVYDWRAPAAPPTILATGQYVLSDMAFASDGRYLAIVHLGIVRVYDRRARAAPTILRTDQATVPVVALAPDGRHLASAGFDGTVRVVDWRAPAAPPTILRTAQSKVLGVAFAGDGRHLASAGDDGTVRVYDWRAPAAPPTILRTGHESVLAVAFAPDGRHLASAGVGGRVNVHDWRAPSAPPTILPTGHEKVLAVAFAPDGRHLASAGDDGTVRVFECQRCGPMSTILKLARERLPREIP
jgi:WD40 repeat protein